MTKSIPRYAENVSLVVNITQLLDGICINYAICPQTQTTVLIQCQYCFFVFYITYIVLRL